ncbi:MAG: 1,4-dihydroxy-2-naphthoate polyprenyltransferase [Solirubrobacterales bacterium]
MSSLRIWLMAARPRTLPAAVAPVLVGSAAAAYAADPCAGRDICLQIAPEPFDWARFAAALVGSIFIQIGTNLANDYSDARRGADTAERLGPVRVTSAGLVAPRRVLVATWVAFGVAVLAGLYLATQVGPEILAVGFVSILAGVLYTGGPKPYGYAGLGEVFVFLFFGLVAVNGSYYVQREELDWMPFALSVPIGLLATAILVVNNLRDIETDRRAGKTTLAVRLGRPRTRLLYAWMVALSFVAVPVAIVVADAPAWSLLALGAAALASRPLRAVLTRTDGEALNGALAGTGLLLAAFSLLLSAGLLIAAV